MGRVYHGEYKYNTIYERVTNARAEPNVLLQLAATMCVRGGGAQPNEDASNIGNRCYHVVSNRRGLLNLRRRLRLLDHLSVFRTGKVWGNRNGPCYWLFR